MPKVDKHFGDPVFFSVLSRAHTFSTGSFSRSSDNVTSNDVPSTCFICVIEPVSWALKDLITLNACERIQTSPSLLPRNRFSDPVQTALTSLLLRCQHPEGLCTVGQATDIEQRGALAVVWWLHFRDVEEIERFPLQYCFSK